MLNHNNAGCLNISCFHSKGFYASVVDHIAPDFVTTISIPRLRPEKEKEIADKVREAEAKYDEANRIFTEEHNVIEAMMFSNIKK